MLSPDAAGGGGGGAPAQLNSDGDGVWTYTKALKGWLMSTDKVENSTKFAAASAAAASPYIAAQKGTKKEVRQALVYSLPCSSRSTTPELVQLCQPVGKRGETRRWDSHKKETCKCAVCMQCRGEQKSTWFNHDQMNCPCAVCRQHRRERRPRAEVKSSSHRHDQLSCACAVCRQSRRETRPPGGEPPPLFPGVSHNGGSLQGKYSTPSMPAKRGSWLSRPELNGESRAFSRDLPLCGGGQLQMSSPFAPSQLPTSFHSCNNSSSASLWVRPESCTLTGIPITWQQKLSTLARGRTDVSSVPGISPISSSLRCESEEIREQPKCEQRFGCPRLEKMDLEQQALQTNLFSNSRCSGWPNPDTAFSKNFTGSNSDGIQRCTSDSANVRRSCGHPAVLSYNRGTGLSWQDTVNRCQDAAGTSFGLHNAESPLLASKNLNLQSGHSWESGKETASAVSAATERDAHWSTYPTLGDMTGTEPNAAGVLPDPFLSHGQRNSFFGGHSSSVAHVQPHAASHSSMFPEMDVKSVYVPVECSNSPRALSGRSSVAQFPFGLEVQAEAEHDVYQPVIDLEEPIHTQSTSFNFDEGTTESSSPPCETTSTTSILNEKDNCSPVMDVDSGDIIRASSSILQGSLEKLMARSDVHTGALAGDQQLQSGCDKGGRPRKPGRQNFSKRLANPDDSHLTVPQKRAKREGGFHSVPKWCQLIHSKYDHLTIVRRICIRSRVPKRRPQSPLSKVLEPNVTKDEKNCNAATTSLAALGHNTEGRSPFEGSIAVSNLWSTSPTNVKESSNWKVALAAFTPPLREAFVVDEEELEEQRENMLHEECTGESLNSKIRFETSSETEAEDSPRDMKIRGLNLRGKLPERLGIQCPSSVVQWNDNIHHESLAREVGMPSSLRESPDNKKGTSRISSISSKIKRSDMCIVNDHLENAIQLADPLIQNVLAKVSHGCRGTKRSRAEGEICGEGRHSGLDPSRHLIPQLEDKCTLQPVTKRRRAHRASLGTSALCTEVEPLCQLDPAKTTNFNSRSLKLTIEVLLPESMKVYYLTKILRARTPELTVWSIDLVRCMAHQSPSNFMVHCQALVPKEHYPLYTTTVPLYMLHRALKRYLCRKTTGLVTWPNVLSGTSIYCIGNIEERAGENHPESQLEIASENICFETSARLDAELLSRVGHVLCAKYGFLLLPYVRLTIYTEDLLGHEPFAGMIEGASSSLRTLKKYCVYSLLGDISHLGGTKCEQQEVTAFEHRQQSLMQEARLIPLRNICFPYWIDKPFTGSIFLICPFILLKRSPPMLRSAADMCIFREQDRTPKSGKLPTQYSTEENLEEDVNADGEQIYSDGVVAEGFISRPVNDVKTSVHNLVAQERTRGSFAFHSECSTSTEPRSLQTPSGYSFQDLLRSVVEVYKNASPPLSNNSECRTDPREIDGPTAGLTSSSDPISKPFRRRGCPKGGWPKKLKCPTKKLNSPVSKPVDRESRYFLRGVCLGLAAVPDSFKNGTMAMDGIKEAEGTEGSSPPPPVDPENTTAQHKAEVEADFEVIHPKNIAPSKRDSEFKMRLQTFLDRPFKLQELKDLEGQAFLRKPLLRLRETRHRVLHVATKKEGMSYLDYHPDLARKVVDAAAPEERLKLLRGFFFWLQHSCISGSFKPWAPDVDEVEEIDDDCVEIPKERFANLVEHHIGPEAKVERRAYQHDQTNVGATNTTRLTPTKRGLKRMSGSQLRAYQHDQTNVGDTKTIHMTPKRRGWKRKSATQPIKDFSKQIKPSMETRVKREKK